jgi:hypothetical protein
MLSFTMSSLRRNAQLKAGDEAVSKVASPYQVCWYCANSQTVGRRSSRLGAAHLQSCTLALRATLGSH